MALPLRNCLHAGVSSDWTLLQHTDCLDHVVSLQFISRSSTLDQLPSQCQQDRYMNIYSLGCPYLIWSKYLFWNTNLCRPGFVPECQKSSTVDYFFYRETLDSTASIDDSGGIHWPIVLCLLAAWTAIMMCYIRGIGTSGKVGQSVRPLLALIDLGNFLQRSALYWLA